MRPHGGTRGQCGGRQEKTPAGGPAGAGGWRGAERRKVGGPITAVAVGGTVFLQSDGGGRRPGREGNGIGSAAAWASSDIRAFMGRDRPVLNFLRTVLAPPMV
jgi:hypothetical protein